MFGIWNWFFNKKHLCFLDLETTGLGSEAEIVEIACDIDGNKFESLVKPSKPIPNEVIKIHGITNEMVKDALPIKEVLEKFNEFIKPYPDLFFVGHNLIRFDVPILKNSYHKSKLTFPDVKYMDTLHLSEWYYPNVANHRLQTMCVHLNLPIPIHRAAQDVSSSKALFEKVQADFGFRY